MHETFLFGPRQIRPCGIWPRKRANRGEFDFVPLKRAARYLVGKPRAAIRFRSQKEHVDRITVFVDSDFAGDPVSRKSTTGLVAQIGAHTVQSGSTLQSWTPLTEGEAEFYAVVNGGQVGLSLRSMNMDVRSPMKVEIQSDSSTTNSLTDRLGAGPERNTLIHFTLGYKNEFKTEISVSRRCLQRKCVQMLERSQSLLQYYNSIANLQVWYSTDHGSHTSLQDDGTLVGSSQRWMCKTERHRQLLEFVVNIETGAKLS